MGKKNTDKSYVPSRRMTKTELMLLQIRQKGSQQNTGYFIDVMQYTEPQSVHERRKKRFLAKQKILELLKEEEKE